MERTMIIKCPIVYYDELTGSFIEYHDAEINIGQPEITESDGGVEVTFSAKVHGQITKHDLHHVGCK